MYPHQLECWFNIALFYMMLQNWWVFVGVSTCCAALWAIGVLLDTQEDGKIFEFTKYMWKYGILLVNSSQMHLQMHRQMGLTNAQGFCIWIVHLVLLSKCGINSYQCSYLYLLRSSPGRWGPPGGCRPGHTGAWWGTSAAEGGTQRAGGQADPWASPWPCHHHSASGKIRWRTRMNHIFCRPVPDSKKVPVSTISSSLRHHVHYD